MAKHNVICVQCGLEFDASKPGFDYDGYSRRYTCPDCVKRMKQEREEYKKNRIKQERREAFEKKKKDAKMKQSTKAMVIKIVFGVLIVLGAFGQETFWQGLIAFLAGCAMIAWGVVPYFMAQKRIKEIERKEARRKKVCPYCGATTRGNVCEYCGSDLDEAD